MHNNLMLSTRPINSCHQCGATAYKPVLARDEHGAMRPSGQYQCASCKLLFSTLDEWRHGLTGSEQARQDAP